MHRNAKNSIDPVIDEVRAVRHRISQQCDHDAKRLVAYYMALQQQYAQRLLKADQTAGDSTTRERHSQNSESEQILFGL